MLIIIPYTEFVGARACSVLSVHLFFVFFSSSVPQVFVDDVASAVIALLRAGAAVYGESINVASETLNFEDFVS
jgi:hypothetical protein